jgi:hypothetical protein
MGPSGQPGGADRVPKSEIRSTKSETNPKSKCPKQSRHTLLIFLPLIILPSPFFSGRNMSGRNIFAFNIFAIHFLAITSSLKKGKARISVARI